MRRAYVGRTEPIVRDREMATQRRVFSTAHRHHVYATPGDGFNIVLYVLLLILMLGGAAGLAFDVVDGTAVLWDRTADQPPAHQAAAHGGQLRVGVPVDEFVRVRRQVVQLVDRLGVDDELVAVVAEHPLRVREVVAVELREQLGGPLRVFAAHQRQQAAAVHRGRGVAAREVEDRRRAVGERDELPSHLRAFTRDAEEAGMR